MTIETDHESPHVSALRVLVRINELRLIRDVEERHYVPGREAVSDSSFRLTASGGAPPSLEKRRGVWGQFELEE